MKSVQPGCVKSRNLLRESFSNSFWRECARDSSPECLAQKFRLCGAA